MCIMVVDDQSDGLFRRICLEKGSNGLVSFLLVGRSVMLRGSLRLRNARCLSSSMRNDEFSIMEPAVAPKSGVSRN